MVELEHTHLKEDFLYQGIGILHSTILHVSVSGALASHNIVRFDDTQIEGSAEKETITGLKQAPW